MVSLYDMGLERLKKTIFEMAKLSEQELANALETHQERVDASRDSTQSRERLEQLHAEAVDLASEMISIYQPTAPDRRFIKSCMEMAYIFSQPSRYTYDLLRVSSVFGSLSTVDKDVVEEATRQASEMMRLNVQAFMNRGDEPGGNVARMDEIVDEVYLNLAKKFVKTATLN
jgi:phosphate transport system protein